MPSTARIFRDRRWAARCSWRPGRPSGADASQAGMVWSCIRWRPAGDAGIPLPRRRARGRSVIDDESEPLELGLKPLLGTVHNRPASYGEVEVTGRGVLRAPRLFFV